MFSFVIMVGSPFCVRSVDISVLCTHGCSSICSSTSKMVCTLRTPSRLACLTSTRPSGSTESSASSSLVNSSSNSKYFLSFFLPLKHLTSCSSLATLSMICSTLVKPGWIGSAFGTSSGTVVVVGVAIVGVVAGVVSWGSGLGGNCTVMSAVCWGTCASCLGGM